MACFLPLVGASRVHVCPFPHSEVYSWELSQTQGDTPHLIPSPSLLIPIIQAPLTQA
jgi:hypothetical protein